MNAFAAEVSLMLDEVEAELNPHSAHVEGVLKFRGRCAEQIVARERRFPRHSSTPRVCQFFPKMMQVTKPGPSRMSCICAKDTLWVSLVHWL